MDEVPRRFGFFIFTEDRSSLLDGSGDHESFLLLGSYNDSLEVQVPTTGAAPRYPDWVYNHVVLPRLLWEEAEERRLVDERRNQITLTTSTSNDNIFTNDTTNPPGYDFEWWLDSSEDEENQLAAKLDNKNHHPLISWSDKNHHPLISWSDRFLQVKARRQKLEEEKLAKILNNIDRKNDKVKGHKNGNKI